MRICMPSITRGQAAFEIKVKGDACVLGLFGSGVWCGGDGAGDDACLLHVMCYPGVHCVVIIIKYNTGSSRHLLTLLVTSSSSSLLLYSLLYLFIYLSAYRHKCMQRIHHVCTLCSDSGAPLYVCTHCRAFVLAGGPRSLFMIRSVVRARYVDGVCMRFFVLLLLLLLLVVTVDIFSFIFISLFLYVLC